MSKAKLPAEPASASQNRAADDSERVSTDGRIGIFALERRNSRIIGHRNVVGQYVRRQHFLGVFGRRGMCSRQLLPTVPRLFTTARPDT